MRYGGECPDWLGRTRPILTPTHMMGSYINKFPGRGGWSGIGMVTLLAFFFACIFLCGLLLPDLPVALSWNLN